MKANYLLLLFILSSTYCAAKEVFLKTMPAESKVAVAFTAPVKSICFFEIATEDAAFQEHKKAEREVYDYFGVVTTDFPIFNIGDEDVVEYDNEDERYFFYRPHAKGKTGMVISDGKQMPIVVYDPSQYLATIKSYLKIESADDVVPKTKTANDYKTNQHRIELLMRIKYQPDDAYAKLLIEHGNTVHYFVKNKEFQGTCQCREIQNQLYKDSTLKTKMPTRFVTVYNENADMVALSYYLDNKLQNETFYNRYTNNLLKNMTSVLGGDTSETRFVYEPDRYHTIHFDNGKPYSYETFFLNNKKQCIRRISHRTDRSLVWDIKYEYDKHGRLIREEDQDDEKIYEYKDAKVDYFSAFSNYDKQSHKLLMRNERIWDKDVNVFVGKDGDGKQTFKSVTITKKDCSSVTYSFDADNKLSNASIATCVKP